MTRDFCTRTTRQIAKPGYEKKIARLFLYMSVTAGPVVAGTCMY
ncbi:hypothetical protein [Methanoregula sp.]